jgi:hypothetical protein
MDAQTSLGLTVDTDGGAAAQRCSPRRRIYPANRMIAASRVRMQTPLRCSETH